MESSASTDLASWLLCEGSLAWVGGHYFLRGWGADSVACLLKGAVQSPREASLSCFSAWPVTVGGTQTCGYEVRLCGDYREPAAPYADEDE